MAYRAVLRSEPHQRKLEKEGAVVIPFLMEHNVEWILKNASELPYRSGNESAWVEQTERLHEKLQSKVEYRCINCEPFHYELVSLRSLETDTNRPYRLFPAVTNELQHPSLRFVVPLRISGESLTVNYLPKAHTVSVAPRIEGRPDDFRQFEQTVLSNMKAMEVKSFEAAVLFSSVPHTFCATDSSLDMPVLIITVLPYEADAVVIVPSGDESPRRFRAHRARYRDHVQWSCGDETILHDMRPVFNLDIPFPFDDEIDPSHIFQTQRAGGGFLSRFLNKLLQ